MSPASSTARPQDGRPRILLVEDDRSVRDALSTGLRLEGYDVETLPDGAAALERLTDPASEGHAAGHPDALVLDLMMPHMDGLTLCRRLRSMGDAIPILMVTARHEVADRVSGLDAGADDYVVKPFALDEIAARLRALLRRTSVSGAEHALQVADLELDPEGRTARRGQRTLDLTKTEFDLLELLLMNAGVVLTRDVIYDRIWGYDFETRSRSLDVYIGYLRTKTEEGGEPRLVHTVRGVGYVARAS